MREDMARVIVQRPRIPDRDARKGRSLPLDQLPAQEGMRRPHVRFWGGKQLNEDLAPLRRYLERERQVGRPWDKVYANIAKHLRADSTVQQHVRIICGISWRSSRGDAMVGGIGMAASGGSLFMLIPSVAY